MISDISVDLLLFIGAAFAGALVAGTAGFAFGLVASALWLHFISPAESAPLIAAFAIIVQGIGIWALRKSVDLRQLAPYLIGSAAGVPIGVVALRLVPAEQMRPVIGALVVIFALHSLVGPKLSLVDSTPRASAVGFLSGVIGGSTGLGGLPMIVWSAACGWPKEKQRAIFQPVVVAIFIMSLAWMGGAGVLTARTGELFFFGLPAVVLGTWLGLRLFGRTSETAFRNVVLWLLLGSGMALLAPVAKMLP